ncbi:hypothetical protein K493DRAFT_359493 [Basidiobolus meristosporus CBS 931.73]|uniref:Uncharacterized protein n=1 Tax=Basidiobolus meristosporus CBS 931.73 TaxID=1314790 RepID=A0A1Y1XSK6_9FUNG|nr:hypothetical protein K493DRAFT_359493 [Basidiobolus meristosporus CBS 931.73]|eukprot:ORX88486.1 hypothetical protein K493DRAFT_359493 [Basidiobolus meristosporus CBS 931.73]
MSPVDEGYFLDGSIGDSVFSTQTRSADVNELSPIIEVHPTIFHGNSMVTKDTGLMHQSTYPTPPSFIQAEVIHNYTNLPHGSTLSITHHSLVDFGGWLPSSISADRSLYSEPDLTHCQTELMPGYPHTTSHAPYSATFDALLPTGSVDSAQAQLVSNSSSQAINSTFDFGSTHQTCPGNFITQHLIAPESTPPINYTCSSNKLWQPWDTDTGCP